MITPARLVLVAAAASVVVGAGCSKPQWLTDFENRMDESIPRVEEAMDKLAADLPKLVDPLDAVLADKTRALDTMLREQIDGLNVALDDARGELDAALVARVEQIANFATLFSALVGQIARREQRQLTVTVNDLLATTDAGVASLLTSMRLATRNPRQAGDAIVADAYSITQDLIVRGVGGALLLLGLIGGAVTFLLSTRRPARVIALSAALPVMLAGMILLVSMPARAKLIGSETITIARNSCPEAIPLSDAYLVRFRAATPLPGDAVVEGARVVRRLLACVATTGSRKQFDIASGRLGAVRRLLGIDTPCRADVDCPGGHRCQRQTGTCTDRCASDQQCKQAQVCHEFLGKCLALCGGGGTQCPAPSVCQTGRCVEPLPVATGPGTEMGRGGRVLVTPVKFLKGGLGYAARGRGDLSAIRLLPAMPGR